MGFLVGVFHSDGVTADDGSQPRAHRACRACASSGRRGYVVGLCEESIATPQRSSAGSNPFHIDADWRSDVELPVAAQGSPLDFLFAQEEVECCGNRIGALAQLFRQVALADDYVPSWVSLMDIAPVGRNPVGECPEFLLVSSLCSLISNLIGFQTPSARSCNSDKTSDHCATLPV